MHPLMLPNPSGEGLLFYKKRKMMDGYAEENTCDNTGMYGLMLVTFWIIHTHTPTYISPLIITKHTSNVKKCAL